MESGDGNSGNIPLTLWEWSHYIPIMKLHPTTQAFVDEIEAFCAAHGWSDTRFGKSVLNDERFVHDIKKRGRNPSPFTVDRVREFMSAERVE